MKRIIILVIIIIASLFLGFIFGAAIENKFDILSANKEVKEIQEVVADYNAVEIQYFNMVKDEHEREILMKAYDFLEYNDRSTIDYSVKPEFRKAYVSNGNQFFNDDYYLISFRTFGIIVDNKLIKNIIPYDITVGIDVETEKTIKIFPH